MKQYLYQNWKSGLTVSLISIPLSLALAIASGATPLQGIITAFWAGLIGSIFGGSHYNIIGPTGALSGVLISYSFAHGYESLSAIAIESGVIIFISYLFHLDKYIIFIPRSVIHGFTLGIAIIIGLGQLDNALGINGIEKTDNLMENTWLILKNIRNMQPLTLFIFLTATLFMFFWNKKFKKFPGAILVALLSIVTIFVFQSAEIVFDAPTLHMQYPDIRNTLFSNAVFTLPPEIFFDKEVVFISITTAIIAILETLLSGQIADHKTNTKFNRSKEVLALSLANIGSGLMGGIPATAALARTALNINSGANHRTSGILHAFFLSFISLFLMEYFKLLPMVIIAAILAIVAINMVEKKHFIRLIENEKTAFVLSLIVMLLVVFEDPIVGIIAGTVFALLIFVSKVSYGQTELQIWKEGRLHETLLKNDFLKRKKIDSDIIVYEITGTLTYINTPAHLEALEKVKGNLYVILCLQHAFYADMDGIDYLGEIIAELKKHNQNVILTGINKEVQKQIKNEIFYKDKIISGKIYASTTEALKEILPSKKIQAPIK